MRLTPSAPASSQARAAAVDVRAGDVHLQPADLLLGAQLFADLGVFDDGEAADVRHDGLVKDPRELWQLLGDDGVDAGVLQPDGVEQPARVLRDARRGVAEARLARRPLEGERAEQVDVVELRELIPIAERAARGDHRVFQRQAAERDGCVYHTISPFRRTGPSLQMRFVPYFVLHEQPMHAPKPQPMRSSKLNWPSVRHLSYTARSIGSGPQV